MPPKDKPKKCWTKPKVSGGTYTTCVDGAGNQLTKKPKFNVAKKMVAKKVSKPKKEPTMPKVIPAKPRVPLKPKVVKAKAAEPAPAPAWISMKTKKEKAKKDDILPSILAKTLLGYSENDPIDFVCYKGMSMYMYLEILRRNKNDCIMGINAGRTSIDESIAEGADFPYYTTQLSVGLPLDKLREPDVKNRLLAKYEECVKNGKILCVPVFKKGHANMMIFNYHLNKIEYYEPHGSGTKPFEDATKRLAEWFRKFGSIPQSKTIGTTSSAESCPRISAATKAKWNEMEIDFREDFGQNSTKSPDQKRSGLQIFDDPTRKQSAQSKFETNGFCCMWSFLHMDYRLKHPTLPPNQLSTELAALAEANPTLFFRRYIRGYTNDLLENLIKIIGIPTLRKINVPTKKGSTSYGEMSKIITPIIVRMWKDATK